MIRNFTTLVTQIDPVAACMQVLYVADGYEPVLVGVRAQRENEKLEDVLIQYAPVAVWDIEDARKYPLVLPELYTSHRFQGPAPVEDKPAEPEVIRGRVDL